MNPFCRFVNKASKVLLLLGGATLVLMMLLACANMVLRAVWMPVKGTYELMGFLGALTTAFGLAWTQINKGHIALTILAGKLPPAMERIIDAVSQLACCVFFGLIAWRTTAWAFSLVRTGEVSETLRVIYYPFPMAVALGCLALTLVLLCELTQTLWPGRKNTKEAEA